MCTNRLSLKEESNCVAVDVSSRPHEMSEPSPHIPDECSRMQKDSTTKLIPRRQFFQVLLESFLQYPVSQSYSIDFVSILHILRVFLPFLCPDKSWIS